MSTLTIASPRARRPGMKISLSESGYTPEVEYAMDLGAETPQEQEQEKEQVATDSPTSTRTRNWRPTGHERAQKQNSGAYDSSGQLKVAVRARREAKKDCGICEGVAVDPIRTICCGALFCKTHIDDWLHGPASSSLCPACDELCILPDSDSGAPSSKPSPLSYSASPISDSRHPNPPSSNTSDPSSQIRSRPSASSASASTSGSRTASADSHATSNSNSSSTTSSRTDSDRGLLDPSSKNAHPHTHTSSGSSSATQMPRKHTTDLPALIRVLGCALGVLLLLAVLGRRADPAA